MTDDDDQELLEAEARLRNRRRVLDLPVRPRPPLPRTAGFVRLGDAVRSIREEALRGRDEQ